MDSAFYDYITNFVRSYLYKGIRSIRESSCPPHTYRALADFDEVVHFRGLEYELVRKHDYIDVIVTEEAYIEDDSIEEDELSAHSSDVSDWEEPDVTYVDSDDSDVDSDDSSSSSDSSDSGSESDDESNMVIDLTKTSEDEDSDDVSCVDCHCYGQFYDEIDDGKVKKETMELKKKFINKI